VLSKLSLTKLILLSLSSMIKISQTYIPSNHLWKAKILQIASLFPCHENEATRKAYRPHVEYQVEF